MRNSGYHDCPCRDCFQIAIGCDDEDNPDLCSECEESGCSADGDEECSAPHAYNAHCGDTKCCGEYHPAVGDIDMHAPTEDWYAACPLCNTEDSK